MPNEKKPNRKKRYRYKITKDRSVRVTGPGWVVLSEDGKTVRFTADRQHEPGQPIDQSSSVRLQFPANDPEG